MWVGVSAETGEGWEDLRSWCEATLPDAVRREDHGAAGAAALGLGHLAYCAGRYRDADRWLAEAQLHYEQHDLLGLLAIVSANQAGVAAALGDTPAVLAARDRCLAAVRGDPPPRNQRPFRRLADAWAAQAEGEAAQAQAMLLAGADELAPTPLYAVRLAYEALRQGAPAGEVAPRLAELDARSDASLPAAEAAHAAGLAAEDGDALLAAAERLADIGALRYGAEAAADAARAYLAAGRQPEARRAAARSRGLCVPDQGAQPLEIPGLSEFVALSERERQLAELAAAGRTNAEIAERLVLSVRTVESHIYRAMQKLGVGDRRELGRFTDQLR
jgi:DNA-binding NarL/FixJ family response regulator